MNVDEKPTVFDVIVVGGSYAGLSAATQIARARRTVLVVDAGQRRNRFAQHSHGFLTQDGSQASEVANVARSQLQAYPYVTWANETAILACKNDDNFELTLSSGDKVTARRIILATGVTDTLPSIPGLAERWGKHVFHCPYCHGYELDEGSIGVIATSELSMHQALMLPDWGQVTLFMNNAFTPTDAHNEALNRRGVVTVTTLVERIEDEATVVLADGRVLSMKGLFVASRTTINGSLAEQLSCAVEAGPIGDFVTTDMMKATNVPGVFCCGDMARGVGNVALAVADGALAGMSAHRSLIDELAVLH